MYAHTQMATVVESSWQNSVSVQVPTAPLHKFCDLGEAAPYWAMGIDHGHPAHTHLSVIGSGILTSANYYSTFPWLQSLVQVWSCGLNCPHPNKGKDN